MRVEKFDDQLIATLRALGFDIADDNESAEIEATVHIVQPQGRKDFLLQVQLKDYTVLSVSIPRVKIMNLVEEEK
jgi:hypothetical protein